MNALEAIRNSLREIDHHRTIIANQLNLLERDAQVLKLLSAAPSIGISLSEISQVAMRVGDVAPEDFFGKARPQFVCDARKIYYLLARELTKRSSGEIGRHLRRSDHGTALYGIAAARGKAETDPEFAAKVSLARRLLLGENLTVLPQAA